MCADEEVDLFQFISFILLICKSAHGVLFRMCSDEEFVN
jgi:hypothetical protein